MSWHEQRPRDPQQQHGLDMIGVMVRSRRVFVGWTQRRLEVYSGIDQTVISRIENGKQYGLRWSRFAQLVEALGGLDVPPPTAGETRPVQERRLRVDLEGGEDAATGRGS
jgi:transcriptional regulator with XRE-family HTH domain